MDFIETKLKFVHIIKLEPIEAELGFLLQCIRIFFKKPLIITKNSNSYLLFR